MPTGRVIKLLGALLLVLAAVNVTFFSLRTSTSSSTSKSRNEERQNEDKRQQEQKAEMALEKKVECKPTSVSDAAAMQELSGGKPEALLLYVPPFLLGLHICAAQQTSVLNAKCWLFEKQDAHPARASGDFEQWSVHATDWVWDCRAGQSNDTQCHRGCFGSWVSPF